MNKRSPILGYNHNFKHRGLVFHVQTEDSGVDNPHVFTHLFNGGVIVLTRKLVYDSTASEDAVKALMQAQHKAMLKDLKKGTFDAKITEYFSNDPELLPAGATIREPANDGVPEEVPEQSSVSAAIMATASAQVATRPPDDTAVMGAVPKVSPRPPSIPPPIAPRPTPSVHDTARFGTRVERPASVPNLVVGAQSRPVTGRHPPVADLPIHDTVRVPFAAPPPPSNIPKPMDGLKATTGEYQILRRNTLSPPTPPPAAATPAPSAPQPPTPASGKPSGKQRRPDAGGGVVVSRPAVVVGAAPKPVGAPSTARPRRTREDSRVLFGRELISERSLDEVILAYLGEDSSDE